jgi:hypothetical protein
MLIPSAAGEQHRHQGRAAQTFTEEYPCQQRGEKRDGADDEQRIGDGGVGKRLDKT